MGNNWINSKTHKTFLDRLESSKVAVWLAAQILEDEGLSPRVNHTVAAPTHKVRGKYIDNGDIDIDGGCVEVKWQRSKRTNFTDRKSWPYPYVNVCPAEQWSYLRKPVRWMLFSCDLSHYVQFGIGAVDPNNIRTKKDTIYNVTRSYVVVEKKDALFLPVPSRILLRYKTVIDLAFTGTDKR